MLSLLSLLSGTIYFFFEIYILLSILHFLLFFQFFFDFSLIFVLFQFCFHLYAFFYWKQNVWASKWIYVANQVTWKLKFILYDIVINNYLVRGLDYYNNICYEFISNDIGAQDSFLAGGRYDGLIKKMGGPDYPGCGFALGVERLMMLRPNIFKSLGPSEQDYYVVIAVGKENRIEALKIINKIRKITHSNELTKVIDFISRDNLSKGLRYASEKNANFAVIIGQEEMLNKEVTIKDLKKRTQKKVKIEDLGIIFY